MEITKLPGVAEKTAKKYESGGITLVEQLLTIPPPQVASMLKIDNDSANILYDKARSKYYKDSENASRFIKASEKAIDYDKLERISTGTKALDELFNGGICVKATTEIYGEFGCGKTQMCLTQAVRVQLPKEKGGLGGKCIWIDSEGTFESDRIKQIATSLGIDPEEALENIIVAKADNSRDQKILLLEAQKLLVEDSSYKLIVIDSAIGLFRQDFSGRAMLSERQKYLDEFLTLASNIAEFHKIAVIWTNQVMINPGIFYGDNVQPVGGTVLAHKSTFRVYFKKAGKLRIAKMVDSPHDAEMEKTFGLSIKGVVDKEEAEELIKQQKKEKADAKKAEKATKPVENEAEE